MDVLDPVWKLIFLFKRALLTKFAFGSSVWLLLNPSPDLILIKTNNFIRNPIQFCN